MRTPPQVILAVLTLAAGLAATAVTAQDYPKRPVRVIVGTAAGSGPDVLARAVASQLSRDLGQNFFIENRTGAAGTLANRSVAQAEPDGYTLLFSSSAIAPTPFVYKNPGYDLLRDFAPIATVGILDGYLMLVHVDLPVKSVQEFIDYAKKNRVLYGTPGIGNTLHLTTEAFRRKADIPMEHIPYRGSSEVVTAMLSKNLTIMFVTPPGVTGLMKDKQLRGLAYTGQKPFPEYPDLPLMKDIFPGFVRGSWAMFLAPAKTPPDIINRLNAAVQKALAVPDVANVTQGAGYIPDGRSVSQTAEFFRKEIEQAGEDTKAAGIQAN